MKGVTLILHEDGSIIIPISKDGLPSATALCPTIARPPEDRLAMVEDAIEGLIIGKGVWIEGWKWIRNPAFDRKGEKTTAEIKFRMCKNQDEARATIIKATEILTRLFNELDKEVQPHEQN